MSNDLETRLKNATVGPIWNESMDIDRSTHALMVECLHALATAHADGYRDGVEEAAKVARTYRKLWGSTVEGSQDPGPTIADAIDALAPAATTGEAVSDWEQDAPDHWHRDVDDDVTLSVWPRGMPVRDWVWEVFDFRVDPDEPIRSGSAPTFDEATAMAETHLAAMTPAP